MISIRASTPESGVPFLYVGMSCSLLSLPSTRFGRYSGSLSSLRPFASPALDPHMEITRVR